MTLKRCLFVHSSLTFTLLELFHRANRICRLLIKDNTKCTRGKREKITKESHLSSLYSLVHRHGSTCHWPLIKLQTHSTLTRFRHFRTTPYAPSPTIPSTSYLFIFRSFTPFSSGNWMSICMHLMCVYGEGGEGTQILDQAFTQPFLVTLTSTTP